RTLTILGSIPDDEGAAPIGNTPTAVRIGRTRLGIPSACDRRRRAERSTPTVLALEIRPPVVYNASMGRPADPRLTRPRHAVLTPGGRGRDCLTGVSSGPP